LKKDSTESFSIRGSWRESDVKNSSPLPFEGNHPSASGKPSDARDPNVDKDEILKSWPAKENRFHREG